MAIFKDFDICCQLPSRKFVPKHSPICSLESALFRAPSLMVDIITYQIFTNLIGK